jgi:hypothetical protein
MRRDSLTPKLGVCIKVKHPCKVRHEAAVPSLIGLTPYPSIEALPAMYPGLEDCVLHPVFRRNSGDNSSDKVGIRYILLCCRLTRRLGPPSPNIVGHLHAMESCRHTDRAVAVQVRARASCGLKRCFKSRMLVLSSAVGC